MIQVGWGLWFSFVCLFLVFYCHFLPRLKIQSSAWCCCRNAEFLILYLCSNSVLLKLMDIIGCESQKPNPLAELISLRTRDCNNIIFLSWRKTFCSHCRRERQLSVSNNEESPGNHEVLNFSMSGAGQLTVHKGKCLGKQNYNCSFKYWAWGCFIVVGFFCLEFFWEGELTQCW